MQAWEHFLRQQEIELGIETVQKWLRSLKILRFDACNLYLEAKDSFQQLWFEEHIRPKILKLLVNGNHKRIKVHLTVASGGKETNGKESKGSQQKKLKKPFFELNFDALDPHALFHNFVVSEDNQITYQILSEQPALSGAPSPPSFNPIYLYGPPGSGKTHLLMGLAHCFLAQGHKALYVRAELFTDHLVTAIRAGEMSQFRQAYRNADILIIDDLHSFSRKGTTQEEFFHTFNTLHLHGKQIILAANCPPQELQMIEPRLVSRFEWGIVLPLKILKDNEIKSMLKAKMDLFNFPLSEKITDFLMSIFTSSPKALVRAFEAIVLRLHLDSRQTSQQLTLTTVKSLLADLISEEQKSALTPPKIIQATAEHYGLRSEDILGKSQTRECALPRQIAMYLCREKLKMPFMKIGEVFSRDHSTVISSVKFIQKSIEEDHREIAGAWNMVSKKLQQQ